MQLSTTPEPTPEAAGGQDPKIHSPVQGTVVPSPRDRRSVKDDDSSVPYILT